MTAKELHDQWKDAVGRGEYPPQSEEVDALVLRALALLASVEGSDEEIVRRLIRCAELSGDDGIELTTGDKFRCNYREEFHHAAARIVADEKEKERLRAELQKSQNKLKASGRYKLREENATLKAELASVKAENKRKDAEIAAWQDTGAQFCRNEGFYRDLLDVCAKHLGPNAYLADDGTRMEDPLRLKIPELVANLKAHAEAMAEDMEGSHKLWNAPSLLAYRAAHPKDAP